MTAFVSFWSWLGLWLLLAWIFAGCLWCLPHFRGKPVFVFGMAMAVAAVVSQIPWFGYPLRYWSASLAANFSVPFIGLLLIAIAERVARVKLFRRSDWLAAWIFGAVASLLLYPSALGLGPGSFDSYSLGWPWYGKASLVLFAGVAGCTAFLLLQGSRFAFLLLLASVGYFFQVQESINLWDYILDPIYGGVSLIAVATTLGGHLWRRRLNQG